MRRSLVTACLALAALLALAPGAAARSAPLPVKVGHVSVAGLETAQPSLLIPVRYPIQIAGRSVRLRVSVEPPGSGAIQTATIQTRASAGALRSPERRRAFSFVHRFALGPALVPALRAGGSVAVRADATLDADRDGTPELSSSDSAAQPLAPLGSRANLCSSVPALRVGPGQRIGVELPVCAGGGGWRIAERPEHGSARIRDGRLIFSAGKRFRGTTALTLAARPASGASASAPAPVAPVRITVGDGEAPIVRALGDSVTAGFGYYEDGSQMGLTSLLGCRPGESEYDDACSSNSKVRSNEVKGVEYAADYGLSNNVSWVAQWANEHGVTDFKNLAVSGSEPSDWFGKGQFAKTTAELAGEDPDYVLLTIGANPLLSNMLFGLGNIGCGIWADVFGRFRECVEEEFTAIGLRANLKTLYSNLVEKTEAEILVMQYHLSIPTAALYGVDQIAEMGRLINEEIEAVAREVSPSRITVVSPPHFDVGLNLAPLYPPSYKCKGVLFNSRVDGPSVQATISQTAMRGLHPLEFCPGLKGVAPWVISGDTGIHPSAAGYTQMASQVPAPE